MFWFFRRRYDFYALLASQAKASHDTLESLIVFMDHPTKESGRAVSLKEKDADIKRSQLVTALNASFVTPIDREDIFQLSGTIDDMADYAKSTVAEMELFEVKPNPRLREMAVAMENGARLLVEAVVLLPKARTKGATIGELLIKVKKLENFTERIYRQALKELFESTDLVKMMKTREIYRHLSNAADRMDAAANILGDILVKMG